MAKLRTQTEIMQSWNTVDKTMVSIVCTTYNHEKYIEDAIKGFLIQETDFPFEIIIHDDASTDMTADIIREYEKKYPEIIKPIYQVENQYSKGIKPSVNSYKIATGKYIALCEGDDYWIDRHKLTKQISGMKNNPNCNISFHAARQFDLSLGCAEQIIGRYATENCIVKFEDVILKTHGMIPTASCLVKTKFMNNVATFYKENPYLTVGDIYIQIIGSLGGGAMYIDEVMSVYRLNVPDSWNDRQSKNYKLQVIHANSKLKSFIELDKLLNYQYASTFKLANNKVSFAILRDVGIPRDEKVEFFKMNHKFLISYKKVIGAIIAFVPGSLAVMLNVNRCIRFLKK